MSSYENFYSGTSYSLEPDYGELFTGYRIPVGSIGAPTGTQTANQIQEVANLLNQGIKVIEVQAISPEIFEQIPKQHFKEINRLTKLTGTETTVHAPLIDPAGFTKEGWSESSKEMAERQLKSILDKSHELNPDGNIPITIHASGIAGTEYAPGKEGIETERLIVINQETKQLSPIEKEERIYPGMKKPAMFKPEEELDILNKSEWDQTLSQLSFYKQRGTEIARDALPIIVPKLEALETGKIKLKDLTPEEQAAYHQLYTANNFIRDTMTRLNSLFNRAYKYSSEEEKKTLMQAAEKYTKELGGGQRTDIFTVSRKSQAVDNFIEQLSMVEPKTYVPIEEFAAEKAADTLAKVAFHGYDKYGKKAPIVSIENLFPGMAFSRSEQLKELVEQAREKFAQEASKKGYGKSEASEMAKKLIGVTWDVGHLNMLRKAGFKEEEIIKETKEMAKYIKHVHLTDNFGFTDSHLPPGMGNVPVQKIMKELEKEGFKGKTIVEAGGFVQQFKRPPTEYILEAMGSPLYNVMMAQPYWNQIMATQGNYFAFPSAYFPEQHVSLYGTGFSALPSELGGQIPGKQSRATGTPMA
ncbi:MAG: TIM barrel protein [Nanoarchaeota archaeon]